MTSKEKRESEERIKETIIEIGSKVNIKKVEHSIPEVHKVIMALANKIKR